ncbi:MAG: type III pantothenate kinase [Dehalococcoidia bacterium]|nr:MAG: type III pantothenate kinase [Dehalococcoidia bacterium]
MLLAIGIGNTSIKLGVFDGEKLASAWHIATDIRHTPDEYSVTLFSLLEQGNVEKSDLTEAAMWCTVPPLIPTFEELLRKHFGISPLVVGAGIKTGVRIRMDNPREVGADRIVNAAAVHSLYPGTTIIVDMGTATTFDTVSREGDYLGGAIAPGIMMAAEALFTRPAQLYRVQLAAPKKAIGTSTVSAMQSGIIFGYTSLVEGMVQRIQRELPEKARVIATGGYASLILKETDVIEMVNPDLALIGLRIINQLNKT